MRRVKINLEKEANRHRNRLVLLEEMYLISFGVQTAPDWTDLLICPALHVGELHDLTNVLHAIHRARCHPKRDTFLRRDEGVVEADYHLSGSSQSVFRLLVIVVELHRANSSDFTEVDTDRVVLTCVERN